MTSKKAASLKSLGFRKRETIMILTNLVFMCNALIVLYHAAKN